MTEHEIPGTATPNKYTSVQVFESKCTRYQLQYKYQIQDTHQIRERLLVDSDQIVSMYNGEAVNMHQELEGLPFTPYEPGPERLVVLTHHRYPLHQVMCVNPNQAPDAR